MELTRLDTKCCLTCQSYITERTFSFDESSKRVLICDPDEGICTDGDRYNKKMKPLEGCFRYRRWNTIDVLMRKKKMQVGTSRVNQEFESEMHSYSRPKEEREQPKEETRPEIQKKPSVRPSSPSGMDGFIKAWKDLVAYAGEKKEDAPMQKNPSFGGKGPSKNSKNVALILVFVFIFVLLVGIVFASAFAG